MADSKISELTAITGANTADDDLLVIVDTSASQTKKITLGELENALAERDFSFGDNDKAIFGAGSDLQIYHDGTNSRIEDINGANLILRSSADVRIDKYTGENMGVFNADGSVDLYYDNSKKFSTTSTGIDVTGTVTADGLTVDGDATVQSTSGNDATFLLGQSGVRNWRFLNEATTGTLYVKPSPTTKALQVTSGGDISFYEDTGTTAKFFWDASAERLGIGTTSPATALHVDDNSSGEQARLTSSSSFGTTLGFRNTATNGKNYRLGSNFVTGQGEFAIYDDTSNATRMFITSSGNVGIGTSSPSNTTNYATLELSGATGSIVNLTDDGVRVGSFFNTVNDVSIGNFTATGFLGFRTNSTERMRIDSSGNLLVGTTTTTGFGSTTGAQLRSNGGIFATVSGDQALALSRTTSNGPIAEFYRDGTTVGSIGTNGNLYIQGPSGTSGAEFANNAVRPWKDGARVDATVDLGVSAGRFKDIYATNALIQTSDQNEKQDIAELSEAEQRVAVAAKGLLRKFRWKDAVAEKGDEARTHFGIIAQDLQAAFAAEGLDAGDYAMFIHSTWTDEETGEERSRMGVRYSELLAFIIAAI